MKREELKALGLTDEQIDKTMQLHGTALDAMKQAGAADKQKVTDLTAQLAQVQAALTQAQTDGATLESLKNQLTEAKNQLTASKKAAAIRDALAEFKPRDVALVMKLINSDKVTFSEEDGKITGLKEEAEALKTSSAYLFEDAADPKGGNPDGGNPGGGTFNMNSFLRGEQ